MVNLMTEGFHAGSVASTIRLTCGGGGRFGFVGEGCGGARFAGMSVVRLPDSAKATKTFAPSALTARARGRWPRSGIVLVKVCVVASKTRTSLLPDTLTKASPPAKTTSAGSSLTLIVSVTIPLTIETTLTLSDNSLTTHASSFVRALTETGSIPTGISFASTGGDWVMLKTERRASALLTAKSRWPSGERRNGEVCRASKLTKFAV